MNFVKRSVFYIIRHKIKSLILLLVLTIIATFVLTGIAIQSSAKDAAKDVRTSVSGKIKLQIDQNKSNTTEKRIAYGNGNVGIAQVYSGDQITDEVVKAVRGIDGVTGYNAKSYEFGGSGVNFSFIPGQYSMGEDTASTDAVLFSEKHDGFANGSLSLEEGRHIIDTDKKAIMISKELAQHNSLKLGDTMTFYIMDVNKNFTFTVVGIFSGTEGKADNALIASMIPSNQCIISYSDLFELSAYYDDVLDGYGDMDFYVEDPIDIQNVYERISNLPEIKGKSFKLNIDTEEYNEISNPLESLQSLVSTLIIVIAIVSVAILALLFSIWTRGRVRETGILMSIGISKPKIVGQLLLETVIIAIFAFGLAYPASHAVAESAGDFIMAQAVNAENLEAANSKDSPLSESGIFDGSMYGDLLKGKPSAENAIKEINVTITPEYLILVYGIGILLIICAVLIASYTIIRLKPREILSKHE